MEVIVTFLGGDLDRPIITGCVYNATHPPPFKLPEEKARSGFRTSSTPDNQGANELSFNDAAGSEQVFLHAQRDYDEIVENNQTSRVGGSRSADVAGTCSDTVGENASLDVAGDRSLRVGRDDTFEVEGNLRGKIDGDKSLEVQGAFSTIAFGTHSLEVRGNRALVVGEPNEPAQSDHYVYGTASLGASERIIVRATGSLLFECGEASIELTKDKIVIKAPTVEISPSKSLECSTEGGPSVTLGEDVEILTKKFRLFTEAGALEVDKDFKVKGTSVQLGYDPSKPSKDKDAVDKLMKPLERAFSNYFLQPYKNKTYHLMVDGLRFEGVTNGEGVLKTDIPEDAKQGVVRLWLEELPEGRQQLYTLRLVDLPPADAVLSAKARLKNLGYFLGETSDTVVTDELRAAVAEFQEDHKDTHGLEQNGEYDPWTAGALEEVHGS